MPKVVIQIQLSDLRQMTNIAMSSHMRMLDNADACDKNSDQYCACKSIADAYLSIFLRLKQSLQAAIALQRLQKDE